MSGIIQNIRCNKDYYINAGGAGSLYVDPEHKVQLVDTPDFPDAFKPLATAMGKALAELRNRQDVKWTYISPAADFQADGERTGKYVLAGEDFTLNRKNESVISYADYAIAMVEEIEKDFQKKNSTALTGKNQDTASQKLTYLRKVKELVYESKDKTDFIKNVKDAFPQYKGENDLEMTADALFPEKKEAPG